MNPVFQSTCPARGTTRLRQTEHGGNRIFQSTCPARGTTAHQARVRLRRVISIHVPREGHDSARTCPRNTHSRFQSTCPARGTTKIWYGFFYGFRDFNPRAPRGARRMVPSSKITGQIFQSTCPARGTTYAKSEGADTAAAFQSTCPARGTTGNAASYSTIAPISIHVPREGHDKIRKTLSRADNNFNPRAPRGARQCRSGKKQGTDTGFQSTCPGEFQSTCPARGTTGAPEREGLEARISIHVPREGHDFILSKPTFGKRRLFQSTCPARGTTIVIGCGLNIVNISIHVPREGHDCPYLRIEQGPGDFNPRAPRGARRNGDCQFMAEYRISIHVPREGHD